MSCYALGKPTPNIMWMFNGQRINPSPRFAWTSADGFGILVIRETQVNDSGIWSCYAENVKNITAGRGSVVMIKSKNAICTPPFFNSKANNQSECLRCHCFGVTNRCFSSNSKLVPVSRKQIIIISWVLALRLIGKIYQNLIFSRRTLYWREISLWLWCDN